MMDNESSWFVLYGLRPSAIRLSDMCEDLKNRIAELLIPGFGGHEKIITIKDNHVAGYLIMDGFVISKCDLALETSKWFRANCLHLPHKLGSSLNIRNTIPHPLKQFRILESRLDSSIKILKLILDEPNGFEAFELLKKLDGKLKDCSNILRSGTEMETEAYSVSGLSILLFVENDSIAVRYSWTGKKKGQTLFVENTLLAAFEECRTVYLDLLLIIGETSDILETLERLLKN